MKYQVTIFLFLSILYATYAQSEFSIEDTDADGDATIEIIAPQNGALELRSMLLGVNQSSGGFLRMLSDDPLSLWTNNIRRMTITPSGDVGIGISSPMTKLFVQDGRIAAETMDVGSNAISQASGFDFYTGDTYQGGMSYVNEGADGKLLFFNNQGGTIALKTQTQSGLVIQPSGQVRIPDLAGTTKRPLYADEDGNLHTDVPSLHLLINSSQFVARSVFDVALYEENYMTIDINTPANYLDKGIALAHPTISANKILVEEISFDYRDKNDDRDINFEYKSFHVDEGDLNHVIVSQNNHIIEETSGRTGPVGTATIVINEVIDQSAGEYIVLYTEFESQNDLRFFNAKIKYKKVYD